LHSEIIPFKIETVKWAQVTRKIRKRFQQRPLAACLGLAFRRQYVSQPRKYEFTVPYKIGIPHEHVAKNPVLQVETRSKSTYRAILITPAQTVAILKSLP
jgi:hypothetical protein